MGVVQSLGPRPRPPQPALNPIGLRRVQRYLLPSETAVIVTRRHWAVVAEPVAVAVLGVILAGIVARQGRGRRTVPGQRDRPGRHRC